MVQDGCWSTVICSALERTRLGDTSDNGWVLGCRLSIGHGGDHATDAEQSPRYDRRLWLEWNDHERHAQSLIDRNPCTGGVGARCMLFEGHGGTHWYAPSNGYLTAAGTGRRRSEESEPPSRAGVATVEQAPVESPTHSERGAHRFAETEEGSPATGFGSGEFTEIVNLRGRAVRGDTPLDDLGSPATASRTGSPTVTEALDAVVVALEQLASAMRRAENARNGRDTL